MKDMNLSAMRTVEEIDVLRNQAYEIRRKLIVLHARASTSHIGSALSSVEILVALYFEIMNLITDKFILSKGHAVSALYSTLVQKGILSEECLDSYCVDNGSLHGHPDRTMIPQVFVSTGSLGHGLPIGVGVAFGAKVNRDRDRVFILLGDGDLQEGTFWEAANMAGRLKLDNLIAIIDANKLQAFERAANILPIDIVKGTFLSLGWGMKEVDGHNVSELIEHLEAMPFQNKMPSVLIANTVKGKGVKAFEDKLEWHYKSPPIDQLDMYLSELRKI